MTLRRSLDHGGFTHVALQVMGLVVGFGGEGGGIWLLPPLVPGE
jgi:hypothetical protein